MAIKVEISEEEKELLIDSIRFSLEKYEGLARHVDGEIRKLARKRNEELNILWEKIEKS